jgi:hypothetical protein
MTTEANDHYTIISDSLSEEPRHVVEVTRE